MSLTRKNWLTAFCTALAVALLGATQAFAVPLNFNGGANNFQGSIVTLPGGSATVSASGNFTARTSVSLVGQTSFSGTMNIPSQSTGVSLTAVNINDSPTGTGTLTLTPNSNSSAGQPNLQNAIVNQINANLLSSPKPLTSNNIPVSGDVTVDIIGISVGGDLTINLQLAALLNSMTYTQDPGGNWLAPPGSLAGSPPNDYTTNYPINSLGTSGQLNANITGDLIANANLSFLGGIINENVNLNQPGVINQSLNTPVIFPIGSGQVQDLEPGVFTGPGRDVRVFMNAGLGPLSLDFPLVLSDSLPINIAEPDISFNGTVNYSINVTVRVSNMNLTLEATPSNSPGLTDLLQVPTLVTTPGNGGTGNFGNILVGNSGTLPVSVANNGTSGSTLTGNFPAATGEFGPGTSQGFSVGAGGSTSRNYTYTPATRGPDSQNITITSNVGNSTITLAGNGVAPVSSLNTAGNNAGFTLVGQSNNAGVTITNIGDGNLSGLGAVSNLNGTAQGSSGQWTLLSSPSISLTDGSSTSLTYQFSPTIRGTDTLSRDINFSNGNPNNTNTAHTRTFSVTGQGVAPVSSLNTASNNAGFTLVGNSNTASVTLTNTGDGNLSGLGAISNLNGSIQAGAGEFVLVGGNSVSLGDGASQQFDYTYTPISRGADSELLTLALTNGSPDNMNQAHNIGFQLQGQGVAPVSTPIGQTANDAGFTLIGFTNTASIDITNVGDGNLSGLGAVSNLNGTLPDGSPSPLTLVGSTSFSIADGVTEQFDYTYTPTVRGTDVLNGTALFSNGSPDDLNNAHSRNFSVQGTGVAPVSTPFDESANNAGFTLVGTTNTATVSITNIGDGNLSGLGSVSNLNGTMPGTLGEFTTGTTSLSITDGSTATVNYTFAPTSRGPQTETGTAFFSNGSPDDMNQAHNRNFDVQGTGVAPVQQTTSTDAPYTRIGTSSTNPPEITVTNTGDGNLSGLGASSNLNGSMDGGTDARFVGGSSSFSLPDGASQQFAFTYTPTTHTIDTSTVTVSYSNGSSDNTNSAQTVNVTLSGQGVGPIYDSTPAPGSTLDFGDVVIGTNGQLTLDISNISTDPNGGDTTLTDLTLLSAVISGPDAVEFSLAGFTPGTVLSQGDLLNLIVNFDPLFPPGQKFATLTILTDQGAAFGSAGASFVYNLTGAAVPEPASIAVFGVATLGGLAAMRWRRRRQGQKVS